MIIYVLAKKYAVRVAGCGTKRLAGVTGIIIAAATPPSIKPFCLSEILRIITAMVNVQQMTTVGASKSSDARGFRSVT
jgi:hypothetical protein